MKYQTLADLKAAYDSGELSREETTLRIDNDATWVYEGETDEEDGVKVFGMHPATLLDQALELLGIPFGNV